MQQGYFITLEGVDGGGKTTQLRRLADAFADCGVPAVCTREPGGTAAADRIRGVVLDKDLTMNARTELLLYLAARAEHVDHVVRPALAAGKVVLCDRFSDSTMVYQGFVRGIPPDQVAALCEFAAQGLRPDLTILLDADPQDLLARRTQRRVEDRLEREGLAFQKQVREGFLALARREPQRICVVDALQTADAVQAEILTAVEKRGILPR